MAIWLYTLPQSSEAMEATWIEDSELISAIDDLVLNLKPHIDNVLDKLLIHISSPPQEQDVLLFAGIGNYIAGYAHARDSDKVTPELAHQSGLASALSQEPVQRILTKYMTRMVTQNFEA